MALNDYLKNTSSVSIPTKSVSPYPAQPALAQPGIGPTTRNMIKNAAPGSLYNENNVSPQRRPINDATTSTARIMARNALDSVKHGIFGIAKDTANNIKTSGRGIVAGGDILLRGQDASVYKQSGVLPSRQATTTVASAALPSSPTQSAPAPGNVSQSDFDAQMAAYRQRQANRDAEGVTTSDVRDGTGKDPITDINTGFRQLQPGDIRYLDPRTNRVVETTDVTEMVKDRNAPSKSRRASPFTFADASNNTALIDKYTQADADWKSGANRLRRSAQNQNMIDDFNGPRFNIRPSREERVAGVLGRNALNLDQQQAEHAMTLARAGLSPDQIKHALAREKMQNDRDIAQGKDAATVDAAKARSGGTNKKADGLFKRWEASQKSYDKMVEGAPDDDGTPESQNKIIRYNRMLRSRAQDLEKYWNEYDGALNGTGETPAVQPAVQVRIPQPAIEALLKNPEMKSMFDAKYGAGASGQYLKG